MALVSAFRVPEEIAVYLAAVVACAHTPEEPP
jgi:hypothetical protein